MYRFFELLGLGLLVDADEVQGVADERELDVEVERGVGAEAGRVVDLQQPGLGVPVDEDVEAEDLEADVVFIVLRLAAAEVVRDDRLRGGQRFRYNIFYQVCT